MKSLISYLSYLPKQILLPFILLSALLLPSIVFADHAPGSVPYQGPDTQGAEHAAFNIFSGDVPSNPSDVGEQDFLTVSPKDQNDWTNNLEACEGEVDLHIYIHNGAETQTNGEDFDGPGVARNSRVKVGLPTNPSNSQSLDATLSADNVTTINDGATITCNGHEVDVEYVSDSAVAYQVHTNQFVDISDDVVGPDGTLISSGVPGTGAGDIPGCWEYQVFVKLTVKVKKVEQPEPVFECTSLVADLTSIKKGDEIEFTANALAQDGATVTSYDFNFGDGESDTVVTDQLTATTTHTYDEADNYTATVTVNFDVGDESQSDSGNKCQVDIKVTEEEPVCPHDPELPADSDECKPPVTPPSEELPVTGPVSAMAGFFGTSALFMGARSWLESRRILRAGLLK